MKRINKADGYGTFTIASIKLVKTLKIQHHATGINARQERQRRGISLREIARRMQFSPAYISDLERGLRNWQMETIKRYEKALTQ
jgi:predicted transcriptional regulator